MRILHCLDSLDPAAGGPARSVPQLALAQARLGHEVGLWSQEAGIESRRMNVQRPTSNVQRPTEEEEGKRRLNVELRSGEEDGKQETFGRGRRVGCDSLADLGEEAGELLKVFGGSFTDALEEFGIPDLVHDHGIWLPFHREIARVCAHRGIPRIVSPRGMLEPWALNHKKWKKKLAWWLYQRRDLRSAAALHATAEAEAEQLRKLGFKQPIIIAANGVAEVEEEKVQGCYSISKIHNPQSTIAVGDVNQASPFRLARESSLRVHNPKRTALFLSRVHPKKGLPILLEAWARLRPDGWRLRIVGPDEGGHVAELKQLCGKLGLAWEEDKELSVVSCQLSDKKKESLHAARSSSNAITDNRQQTCPGAALRSRTTDNILNSDNGQRTTDNSFAPVCPLSEESQWPDLSPSAIIFSGPLEGEAKWEAFRQADLFVLPTYSENFGIAVAEALACGVPVITTTGAPWAGLMEHRCGWWVKPETFELHAALTAAIGLSDAERAEMGARGAEWMTAEFGWEGIARRVVEGYGQILGREEKSLKV